VKSGRGSFLAHAPANAPRATAIYLDRRRAPKRRWLAGARRRFARHTRHAAARDLEPVADRGVSGERRIRPPRTAVFKPLVGEGRG
jgi:hypothetical protein